MSTVTIIFPMEIFLKYVESKEITTSYQGPGLSVLVLLHHTIGRKLRPFSNKCEFVPGHLYSSLG